MIQESRYRTCGFETIPVVWLPRLPGTIWEYPATEGELIANCVAE
jgi:hypothetical protein